MMLCDHKVIAMLSSLNESRVGPHFTQPAAQRADVGPPQRRAVLPHPPQKMEQVRLDAGREIIRPSLDPAVFCVLKCGFSCLLPPENKRKRKKPTGKPVKA